jgi:hypothetical protein
MAINSAVAYETDVVRERTVDGPFLLKDENLLYEAATGKPPSMFVIALIVAFIPPFFVLWSIALLFLVYFSARHDKVWVTNKRIVKSTKGLLKSTYLVESVPIAEIRKVSTKLPDLPLGLIDALFGVRDVFVAVKEHKLFPVMILNDIKNSKGLIGKVKSIASGLEE